ncbi:MAG: fibrobacter succinogenes major paralogous domain-containing protein, partial [Bacteroidales bacterium]|nr:fibrobacter succinogenes major paralogous domain-containing protein [Bacteroidales bacterium]
ETADNSPSETSSTKDDVEYTTKPSENKTFTDSKNGKKKTNDSRPESNTKKEDIDVHETADNSPSETSSTKDDVEYTTKPSENKTSTDSRDGQTYKYVKIGNQYWMAENLNYDAGSGSWVYDNNSSNATTYGRLYDWETACNVCPDGWHLPSDAEWTELTDYLGGENVVGGKMKETGTSHWSSPNEGATNESGFSALPGGCHVGNGNFNGVGSYARFWSSTETNSYNAWFLKLVYDYSVVYYRNYPKGHGFSVRCVKD